MLPNCFQCKHFHVTWDKNFPRGCRAYGVRSIQLPSTVVKGNTKEGCLSFDSKRIMNGETKESKSISKSSGFDTYI